MNIFRLGADAAHVAALVSLSHRLATHHSAAGLSFKSQVLFLSVFAARYLDLLTDFHSLYNSVLKVVFLAVSAWTVHQMRTLAPLKATYDASKDTFKLLYAYAPCFGLAIVLNSANYDKHWHGVVHYVMEYFWTASILLEAIAIVPQLIMLQRYRCVENLTSWYIFFMGAYRGLYVLNWLYQYFYYGVSTTALLWICGTIQTLFYSDFFYYFYVARRAGQTTVLLPQ